MKCPKCAYLGFEAVDRCRNCGYEFALAVPATAPPAELEMRSRTETGGPLVELSLTMPAVPARPRTPGARAPLDLDRIIGAPEAPPDLPLFQPGEAPSDLPPLVSASSTPRKPLAVRRTTPLAPRFRAAPASAVDPAARNLDLPLPAQTPTPVTVRAIPGTEDAHGGARLMAAAIDVALLGGIDAVVLYFTLRLCSLSFGDVTLLPAVPLLGFLLLLNGGYLIAFTTAGGQTIGKMAFGLKVVGPGDTPVPITTAVLRSAGCLVSAVLLGGGLVPALLGGRALHDRVADTRVVQVTA